MLAQDIKESWKRSSTKVEKEFLKLTEPYRVANALDLLSFWMNNELFKPQRIPILEHIENEKYALLLDSFYQFLPFGTAGRRGRVGFGPNRINEATVALSVQGHCNYLLNKKANEVSGLSVIVAYDVRIFKDILSTYTFLKDNPILNLTSRRLAQIACEIYAGCGVQCFIKNQGDNNGYMSTPELSFFIRILGVSGGINISASHNHPDDNGFKFFNSEGAQDIPPYDEELASFMNNIENVTRISFEEGLQKDLIKFIPSELHTEYIKANLNIKRSPKIPLKQNMPPIVYTPLCGTGLTTVADVLKTAGYKVLEHEPQSRFDGTFESVPLRLPNPEIPQASWPAIQTADQSNASIVFSTDPDADRLGILVKGRDNNWTHLNGNEIGAILAYYLILDEERGPRRKGLIIKTLVTTDIIKKIALAGGCEVVSDLFVGFKFIAHVLYSLQEYGHYMDIKARVDDFVLGAEESHGFLLTPKIRDKDAAGASLVLCDLITKLHNEGRNLLDYLDEIILKCGNFGNGARAIFMSGIKGTDSITRLMDLLRSSAPKSLGHRKVIEFKDYLYGSNGKPRVDPESSEGKASNLILLSFENARIIIRPSGTEPKVKIYAEIEIPNTCSRMEAKKQAWELATMMYRECLNLLGQEYQLSHPAELIPDYVEMDLKKEFDDKFTPEFFSKASQLASMDKYNLQEWFRNRLKKYGGGSDSLESMRPALIALCQSSQINENEAIQESLSKIVDKLN